MVQKNRIPNFSAGRDKRDFVSSANTFLVPHDLGAITQSNLDRKANGLELRKTHFDFGTDVDPHSTKELMAAKTKTYSNNLGRLGSA